jgi:hypothetical protein
MMTDFALSRHLNKVKSISQTYNFIVNNECWLPGIQRFSDGDIARGKQCTSQLSKNSPRG